MLAAALSLSGCASMFGGYDLAPNGLPQAEADLRRELARTPESTYEDVVEGERELPDDDLLRLLYAGAAGRYAGQYRESAQLLDVAGYVAEDRVTESVSRQALSFITSDRALPYTPSRTERLMIPYMSAMAFLGAGDIGGAVVEARRIEALLDRYDEGAGPGERPPSSRFLHLLAATIFDAAGESNAATVAYRRAGLETRSAGGTGEDSLRGDVAPGGAARVAGPDSLGEVVVVVERGFVPHRVEQTVVVALPSVHVARLTDGSAAEKAAAAAAAAGQILLHAAAQYGDRGLYYTDRGYRRTLHMSPWRDECDGWNTPDWCDEDFDPYLLRISWPVLFREPGPSDSVRVRAGDVVATPDVRLDVGADVRRDFADERPTILARTVFRAATKLALSETAEAAVSKKDEGAGRLVGLLVNLGTLLTERADTRSWHLLPGSVELVRMVLPAGEHRLALEGARGRDGDLGTVTIRPGATAFVVHRIWR